MKAGQKGPACDVCGGDTQLVRPSAQSAELRLRVCKSCYVVIQEVPDDAEPAASAAAEGGDHA